MLSFKTTAIDEKIYKKEYKGPKGPKGDTQKGMQNPHKSDTCKSSNFKYNQQLPDNTLQVCIKVDPSNQSKKKKSLKSIILTFWMRLWRTEPEQQLYFYDNDKIKADEFPGELSQEIISSARETLKIYKIEKQDFKEKLAVIREDSNIQYNKIVNQRSLSTDMKDIEDNLAKLAKLVKDLKIKK